MSTPMLNGVLSALGASAPALAAVASPSPPRDILPGTFARQLQQAQMPAAAPPRAPSPVASVAPPPAPPPSPVPPAPQSNAAPSATPPRPASPGAQHTPEASSTAATTTSASAQDAADTGEPAEATERAEQTAHTRSSTAPDTAAARRLALLRAARDRSASVDDVKRRAAVEAEAPTGVDPTADGAQRDGLRRLRGAGTDAADPAPTALALTDPTRPDSAAITGLPTAPVDPLAQAAADGMGEPADAAGAAESAGAAGAAGAATPATRPENPVRMPGDGLVNPQVMGLRANTETAPDDAASDAAPGRGGKARDARMAAAGPASDAPGVDPRQLAAIPSKGGADGAGTSFQDVMVAATGRAAASSGADTQAPAPAPLAGLPGFAAELARSSQALTPGGLVGSARELNLPMPMTAAEFVPRLTGDLAVLARDGVQEARVNVHPVELGPISVQITLDGAAAQVHLAADSAQTRDLLEQAMPALAAALRDNGLTLTGGGVFQQARQQPREPSADTGSGRAGTAAAEAGPVDSAGAGESTRRLRPVGALDVYA